MSGVERKGAPAGPGGTEGESGPKGDGSGAPKVRVSPDDFDRSRAASERWKAEQERADRPEHDGDSPAASPPPKPPPASKSPDVVQLLAIFCGVAGLGSLVALESRVVFPTLLVAFAALAFATRGRARLVIGVLAFAALGCAIFAWISHLSSHAHTGLNSELSKANMRLEIVDEVNALRHRDGLKSLNYDAGLSVFAQQRADYAAADHSGFATAPSVGRLPSEETNVWAELAGVACSWDHLFAIDAGNLPVPDETELGFIEDRHIGGPDKAYLSPLFHSVGVGVEEIPGGDISVVIDFIGRPKAGIPWSRSMPNMIGVVVGHGVPDCN